MTTTITTDNLANIPHPAGATHVAEWDDGGEPRRYFRGTSRVVKRDGDPYGGDLTVEIYGSQGTDGDVSRHIMVMEDSATMGAVPNA